MSAFVDAYRMVMGWWSGSSVTIPDATICITLRHEPNVGVTMTHSPDVPIDMTHTPRVGVTMVRPDC